MKKATRFSIGALLFSIALGGMAIGQVTIAQDVESNTVYDDGWSAADNGGSGFEAWSFTTSGGGGSYTGSTGQGDPSFGLFAGGSGGSDFSSASRSFTYGDMLPGQKFTVDLGHSTSIVSGGSVGINLKDGGSTVFSLKFVGGATNWVLNDGGSDFSAGQNYSANTSLTFTFTYEGGSNYSYTFGAGSGSNFTASNTISGIDSFEIFSDDQGSGENVGFNNLKLEGGTLKITGDAGYRLLSSPISTTYSDVLAEVWTQGATSADASNGDPNVFTWSKSSTNGDNTNWSGVTDLGNSPTIGEGFLVYIFADDDFDATDDSFPKTLSVSGTENSSVTSLTLNTNNNGWTLVGNPFASSVDFDDMAKTELTNVAYVWDDATSAWRTYETSGGTGDLSGGVIAPFQGFFIQNGASVSAPDIDIETSDKTSGGTFYGKDAGARSYLRLNVEGDRYSNSAWIQLSEEGSAYEKVIGDALELQPLTSSYAKLGFLKADEIFDIAHLSASEEVTLPIEIESTEGGTYTLRATDFEIAGDIQVIFHDYESEISVPIDESFSYKFELPNLKRQDIPPLTILSMGEIQAKSTEGNRFGITIRPTSVSSELDETPRGFGLAQNYPNPFNPSTTISYTIENAGAVNLSVYNLMGQRVATLVNEAKSAGTHSVRWNAAGAASGMYYYRLESNGQSVTRKMTLIK